MNKLRKSMKTQLITTKYYYYFLDQVVNLGNYPA